ncbi:dephospho-CoA kinase [Levilactobacillus acidifarinae]|uniref:dephospho-CoA kinase n=1 Tax=Levilactobacillus acidifarinae TaxID=267364 RepID=UPI00070E7E25|nr:dephospho-CoA kinase [Levilactobacillus acidifarinae]GEO69933.1 dephospho-CoA kinase [Levilactobacillus acidifarinae]
MTRVWGLTGGIATGKSTVSAWLRQAGIPIIDADLITRDVEAPGTLGLEKIAAAFGDDYLQANGTLDRRRLGQLVFNDPAQLARLTAITTPLIQAEIRRQLAAYRHREAPLVVVDAPTLFEVGYLQDWVDQIMVVATTPAQQKQRLMARNGLSAAEAQARIDRQWPIDRKVAAADTVIDNRGDITQTHQQVVKWLDANKF